MSGFGKTAQPKNTFDKNRRLPEKLKATRVAADVNIVKFSAPRIIGAKRIVQQNTVLPKTSSSKVTNSGIHVAASDTVTRDAKHSNELDGESNHEDTVLKSDNTSDVISEEKKETVQKEVKKILSGTRLFTKAANSPRNSVSAYARRRIISQPGN